MTSILQKGIAAALLGRAILFPCASHAMDWNDYDESPHYAPRQPCTKATIKSI